MADFSDLFDLETSPEFENLWEQINRQIPPSSRPPCSENQTSTTEAKTEDAGTTSVLRTLLNSNGKPATVPLTETKIKTENVPQSDEATLTKQDRAVKTEIPFKRYTSAGPTSTTSGTYSPPHDENWPPAASSTTFANVEDSILTTFRKKNPNKYEALNRRITEPRVTASREFKVLKALQQRIVQDMQQKCKTGYYGEDCSKTCDHCKNNASCGLQSEECDDLGCANSGYQPPLCKGCNLGMYGLHCEKNCSRYCAYDDCDRKTGTCLDGCKSGYIGNFCNQTCQVGKYGINCREICGHCYNNSNCNHGNGTCLEGCEAGYWNHDCKTPCSDGRYGENCQYTCSGHCVNGEACDKTNGSCRSCVHGYQGSKCDRDIRQSPTSFKNIIGPEDVKMKKMILENEKIQKEIVKLEAETEVLRVRKNVLLRLQGILSELSEVVVQLLNDSKI